jgi:hypothetical protein
VDDRYLKTILIDIWINEIKLAHSMKRTIGKSRARVRKDKLKLLWDDLLSRQPARIRATYASLDMQEKEVVLIHLQRMVAETGWQPEQRVSAQAALLALKNQT